MRESNYLPVLINRMVRMEGLPNPNGNGPPANVVAPMQLLESVALILPHFAYARGRPPILARDHNNTGSLLTFSSSQMPRVGPVCISPTQQPAFRWNLDPRWRVLRCPTVSIALCTWDSIYIRFLGNQGHLLGFRNSGYEQSSGKWATMQILLFLFGQAGCR
jgi:hypothetical protein